MILVHHLTHSAALRFLYDCFSLWDYYYIFGSGTKLFVTDKPVVKPVVSVYPAASRAQLEGKSSLLCVASDMFPPLVQISWRRREEDGSLKELSSADSEMSKLRESHCTASILKIHKREDNLGKYICSVKHEGVRMKSTAPHTGDAVSPTEAPSTSASSPPQTEPTEAPAALTSGPPETELTDLPAPPQQYSVSFECRVKLLSVLYSLLILKSLVYCCGLSLLTIFTN